jgi:phospholipid transport system transporter-binding protein
MSSQLSVDPSGLARITGPLTLNTVAALYEQANTEAARGQRIVNLDLEAVPSVDSSGLALLLEWQSKAVGAGNSLHIRNAPADLLSLASLCEANDLLVIEGRNQDDMTQEGSTQTMPDANR